MLDITTTIDNIGGASSRMNMSDAVHIPCI